MTFGFIVLYVVHYADYSAEHSRQKYIDVRYKWKIPEKNERTKRFKIGWKQSAFIGGSYEFEQSSGFWRILIPLYESQHIVYGMHVVYVGQCFWFASASHQRFHIILFSLFMLLPYQCLCYLHFKHLFCKCTIYGIEHHTEVAHH